MDISLAKGFQLFSQELHHHLSPQILQRFAKDGGFIRPASKFKQG
ncbi:hypothetical protein [Bacillus toyonensis]|nr:hypothetical protein [Bacillus toyonensis]MED3185922.1 hypothetical protein [Bacillus toyonensis]